MIMCGTCPFCRTTWQCKVAALHTSQIIPDSKGFKEILWCKEWESTVMVCQECRPTVAAMMGRQENEV